MSYFSWQTKVISDFADTYINTLYNEGFVFGRNGRGAMSQTRSLRIDLSKFELSSENRRVLKKTDGLILQPHSLPYTNYHWSIGKLAKDFYDTKFGDGTFSANKVKELLADSNKSNYNTLLTYSDTEKIVGYCICKETNELIHYCYPFYNLESSLPNLGLGMMLRAIVWAKENGKKYIYLGSFQRPTDTYKLQFEGLEWFDGKEWQTDTDKLKSVLK